MADTLSRYMPLWIVDTPSNVACVQAARKASSVACLTEAVCTTFRADSPDDRGSNLLNIVEVVDLHHSNLAKINIFGVESSSELDAGMRLFGFVPARSTWEASVAYRRPLDLLQDVPELHLDAGGWNTADDVYSGLFAAFGAPPWHGRNFDALNDSLITGNINRVEVPYKLLVREWEGVGGEARSFLLELAGLIRKAELEGCPVSLQIINASKTNTTGWS